MSLVGRGLDKLVQDAGGRFSPGTAIGICIQMLNALRALHGIGYLHRDIKPANAAIGRPEDKGGVRCLFLLDFGMARIFVRKDVSCVVFFPISNLSLFSLFREAFADRVLRPHFEGRPATRQSRRISTANTAGRTTSNLGFT